MLLVRCVCEINSGFEEEARAAARELMENSRDHVGLTEYVWHEDAESGKFVLIEVHDDEASLLNHIQLTDFSRMGALCTITEIDILGKPASAELDEALTHFGSYKFFESL